MQSEAVRTVLSLVEANILRRCHVNGLAGLIGSFRHYEPVTRERQTSSLPAGDHCSRRLALFPVPTQPAPCGGDAPGARDHALLRDHPSIRGSGSNLCRINRPDTVEGDCFRRNVEMGPIYVDSSRHRAKICKLHLQADFLAYYNQQISQGADHGLYPKRSIWKRIARRNAFCRWTVVVFEGFSRSSF